MDLLMFREDSSVVIVRAASLYTQLRRLALVAVSASAMAGCAGGGGHATPDITEVPFTSFQNIRPNQRVVMPSDYTQLATGTATTAGGTITSATLQPTEHGVTTVKLTYDSNSALSAVSIANPLTSVTFDNSPGNSLNCSSSICVGSTPNASGVAVNAIAVGWNYQTFGVWAQSPTATTWIAGAISAGNPTPASAVPATGTATFTGITSGLYVDPSGALFATSAIMTANADFSARTIGFSTSTTEVSDLNGVTSSNAGLDLSGTLIYDPAPNRFTGPVSTANTALSGTATGQFYGPNAQEIGGTYGLTGSGVSGMLGAFGGKR